MFVPELRPDNPVTLTGFLSTKIIGGQRRIFDQPTVEVSAVNLFSVWSCDIREEKSLAGYPATVPRHPELDTPPTSLVHVKQEHIPFSWDGNFWIFNMQAAAEVIHSLPE
jgi:hypothetical protein